MSNHQHHNSHFPALSHHHWQPGPELRAHLHTSHHLHHFQRGLVHHLSHHLANTVQLWTRPCSDPEQVSIAVLLVAVDERQQSRL